MLFMANRKQALSLQRVINYIVYDKPLTILNYITITLQTLQKHYKKQTKYKLQLHDAIYNLCTKYLSILSFYFCTFLERTNVNKNTNKNLSNYFHFSKISQIEATNYG